MDKVKCPLCHIEMAGIVYNEPEDYRIYWCSRCGRLIEANLAGSKVKEDQPELSKEVRMLQEQNKKLIEAVKEVLKHQYSYAIYHTWAWADKADELANKCKSIISEIEGE